MTIQPHDSTLRRPGFLLALGMFFVVIGGMIAAGIAAGIIGLVLRTPLAEHPMTVAFGNLLSIGAVVWWGVWLNHASLRRVLALRPMRLQLVVPIVVSLAGGAVLFSELDNLMRCFLPVPAWVVELFSSLGRQAAHPWSALFLLVVVAPLTEESLCRGLFLYGFRGRYSVGAAVVLSALFFGLIHLNPWQFVSATLLGVLFAWFLLRTGSLVPCLIGHALHNALVWIGDVYPFKIRGFNLGGPNGPVEFQPLWFNLLGVLLCAGGIALFAWMTRGGPPSEEKPEPAAPPETPSVPLDQPL